MEGVSDNNVLTVRDVPHFAPYLQFLVNFVQIHFEYARQGNNDYKVSNAISAEHLDEFSSYLYKLKPDDAVEIGEKYARVVYGCLVVVSRMLICEYGEVIAGRLTSKLPAGHRWQNFEHFRNDLLRHNTQMLMDMDTNMHHLIGGIEDVKKRLNEVTL